MRRLRARFRRRLQLPRIRSIISPADTLTLTNALMGFFAIYTMTGDPEAPVLKVYDGRIVFAAALIGIGMLADSLDGMVARKFGASNLGGDLDTLADAITFVLAPATMVVMVYARGIGAQGPGAEAPVRAVLVAGLVVIMGVLRLARFNANPEEGGTQTFQGLPTPGCAAGIVAVVLMGFQWKVALPVIAVLAFLMMSNVAYPKSRGELAKFALLMVGAGAFVIVGLLFIPEEQDAFIKVGFALASFGIAVSPFLLRWRRAREERRKRDADS